MKCALDVSRIVMGSEYNLQQTKILENIESITTLVRAGSSIAWYSGARIAVIVDGPNGKITKFITNIPGGNTVLKLFGAEQTQLVIENGSSGGKRKTKKKGKKRKSKKTRKSRKSKKSIKS